MKVTPARLWRARRYYFERLGFCFRRRTLVFFERALPAALPPVPRPAPLRIAPISPADFQTLRYLGGWLTPREARAWLNQRNCRLFGALNGAEMVGNCWLELDHADLSFFDVCARLGPRTAYLSKLWVHPSARNQGVALSLMAYQLEQAAREGCARVVICCVPENQPIIRALTKLGCHPFQQVSYVRALWLRRYVFRGAEGGARRTSSSARFVARHLLHLYSRLGGA